MSCKEETKRSAILDHLKSHMVRSCPKCQGKLELQEGALPFGNAMMTTWICSVCGHEDVTVLTEEGVLLEVDPTS